MSIYSLRRFCLFVFAILAIAIFSPFFRAAENSSAERGLYNLTHNPYGAPILTEALFARLPQVWEPEWKAKIDPADPGSAKKIAFERYGLSEADLHRRPNAIPRH